MHNIFYKKRKAKCMTQKDLSKVLGIGRTQITNIELGTSLPSTKLLMKYMIILDIKPIEVYDYIINYEKSI